LSSLALAADKIYLKNGKIYEGKLIGKSEKRFLFSVNADGVTFQMSFFPDEVEKIELDKDSMEKQIPYLKEVETLKVQVKEEEKEKSKTYELSLFKESAVGKLEMPTFSEAELKKILKQDEAEYYERFNEILKRYMDKFAAIQDIYMNLTTATKEEFGSAKSYMDELYFELNNLFVPEAFHKSHVSYLESVKANFLAFTALEQGMLDEAAEDRTGRTHLGAARLFPAPVEQVGIENPFLRHVSFLVPPNGAVRARSDKLPFSGGFLWIDNDNTVRSLINRAVFSGFNAGSVITVHTRRNQVSDIDSGILSSFIGLYIYPPVTVVRLRCSITRPVVIHMFILAR